MLSGEKNTDSIHDLFLSTPIGEMQLNVLCRCIDEDDRELLNTLMDTLNKQISKLEKWEIHPGVFLRKLNEYRLAVSDRTGTLYRCCMVKIPGFDRNLSYLTDDLTLMTGEYVLVPFGNEERLQLARITKIIDCTAENAPFPLDKTKTIVGRTEEPI